MKTKTRLCTLITLLVVAVMSFSTLLFMAFNPVSGADNPLDNVRYGSFFTLPEKNVMVGGTSVPATTTLVSPRGVEYTDPMVTIDEYGVYTLKYTGESGGQTVTETDTFAVAYPYVNVGSDLGSFAYKTNNVDAFGAKYSGLAVSSKNDTTVTFNEIIDLSQIYFDELNPTTSPELFTVYFNPTVRGEKQFTYMYLTFTDIYDPSISFSIRFGVHDSNMSYNTYVSAAANGQTYKGYNRSGGFNLNCGLQGGLEGFFSSLGYASLPDSPPEMIAQTNTYTNVSDNVSFYYDYNSCKIYMKQPYRYSPTNGKIRQICDINDNSYQEVAFPGFTDGKVRMSYTFTGGGMANLVFTEIYGVDVAQETYLDTDKPTIEIDLPEELPQGRTGWAYKIFPAVAKDVTEGEVEIETYAILDGTTDKIPVVDGAFMPAQQGNYTIYYVATDLFDNQTIEEVDVVVLNRLTTISISLRDAMSKGTVAEWFDIARVNVTGGSGDKTVDVSVTYSDGTVSGEMKDGKFKPYKAGVYTVNYVATDYIGQKGIKNVKVTVSGISKPVFENDDVFLSSLIEGMQYSLPTVTAIDYNNDREVLTAKIRVTDANNPNGTILASNLYIPSVSTNGATVKVEYVATAKDGSQAIKTFNPTVYKVNTSSYVIVPKNYFLTSGAVVSMADGYANIKVNQNNANVTYVNPVLYNTFSLKLKMMANTFTSFTVTLIDAYDPTNTFDFIFLNTGVKISANINNKKTVSTTYNSNGDGEAVSFGYSNADGAFYIGSTVVKLDDMPEFKLNKVFVKVSYQGITTATDMRIFQLNNHTFYPDDYDYDLPEIAFAQDFSGRKPINSLLSTAIPLHADVTDPYTYATVTVTKDRRYVKDVNGVEINALPADVAYDFLCDTYGEYLVQYHAYDSISNEQNSSYNVIVWDDVVPEITAVSLPTRVGLNAEIGLPSVKSNDNTDGEVTTYIVVKTAGGNFRHVTNGKFKFTDKGVNYVVYYAIDKNGNMNSMEYKIIVG